MIARLLPLAGILAFIAIVFVWRPWLQARRYGTAGILLFRSGGPAQWVRDGFALVWFGLLLWQAVVVAGHADWFPRRALVDVSIGRILWPIGALLMLAGLALLVAAQLDLGAAWRIGIEEGARSGLVTGGLYRFCRNPIFLAMLVIMAGYALLVPTFLSFVLVVGTYIGVRQQTSAEEGYLARTYGAAYRDYAARVGRFVPGLGRLR